MFLLFSLIFCLPQLFQNTERGRRSIFFAGFPSNVIRRNFLKGMSGACSIFYHITLLISTIFAFLSSGIHALLRCSSFLLNGLIFMYVYGPLCLFCSINWLDLLICVFLRTTILWFSCFSLSCSVNHMLMLLIVLYIYRYPTAVLNPESSLPTIVIPKQFSMHVITLEWHTMATRLPANNHTKILVYFYNICTDANNILLTICNYNNKINL